MKRGKMTLATQAQYARMKGVSRQLVRQWLLKGKIQGYTLPEIQLLVVEVPESEREEWQKFVNEQGLKKKA